MNDSSRSRAQATGTADAADREEHPRLQVRRLQAENARLCEHLAGLYRQVQDLVAALDPEGEIETRRQWWIAGRRAGFWDGVKEGRRQAFAEMEARWNRIAAPIARGNPSHAELELRRWGPGGAGAARPGDFRGIGGDR